MPEFTDPPHGATPSHARPMRRLLVLDPGIATVARLVDGILSPLAELLEVVIQPMAALQPGPVPQDAAEVDAVLALSDLPQGPQGTGHPLLAGRPIVSPASASRRTLLSLGLGPDELGLIAGPDATLRGPLIARVKPGDIGSYGQALSRLLSARALLLHDLTFTPQDQSLFRRLSGRPTVLMRHALSAELGTLFSTHPRIVPQTGPVLVHDNGMADNRSFQLTPRERQVVELLTRGLSSKEIAAELRISPRTVDIYRSNLLTKTRARNTLHLLYMLRSA